MGLDKRSSVRSILTAAKNAIQSGSEDERRWYLVTSRQKNMDTVSDLCLTMADIEAQLLSLAEGDYCGGPLKDQKAPGDLWVFGKRVQGREVYIKLRLSGDEKRPTVTVLSFHFAESPLKYLFKV